MKRLVLVAAILFGLFGLSMYVFPQGDSPTPAQGYPTNFETLNGKTISVEDLAQGRWALGFIVYPGCPACEKMVEWFEQAAQAFPEIKFLFIVPEATSELKTFVKMHAPGIPVLLDKGGALGTELEVKRAPTVLLSAEGMYITRLDWPFTEGNILRELAQSLLIKFPNPRDLLGKQAPNFTAVNLNGDKINLADFPRPLLLVFLNLGCPSCWNVLPFLTDLPTNLAVGLVFPVKGARISTSYWERLKKFHQTTREQGKQVEIIVDEWSKEKGFKILSAYKIKKTPTFILVSKNDLIIWISEGPMKGGILEDAIVKALKKESK